jgi:hypothetical protein
MSGVPVVVIAFCRPDTTARVLKSIRAAGVSRLIGVLDGPRAGRAGEAERCEQVAQQFDQSRWPCPVELVRSGVNLGLRRRVSSGLDEVFARHERAIIVEDDCVPHASFFPYCHELLERYARDERVGAVSGTNFITPLRGHRFEHDYWFSRYFQCWGWATWARAWRDFGGTLERWPAVRDSGQMKRLFGGRSEALFWSHFIESIHRGRVSSWWGLWVLANALKGRLSVQPAVNLVSNIGAGEDATNTGAHSPLFELPTMAVNLPMRHPPDVRHDQRADAAWSRLAYAGDLRMRWKRWKDVMRNGWDAKERWAAGFC